MKMTKISKKYAKDTINDYVYVEKTSYIFKLSMACKIRVANFVRMWCPTWQWSVLHVDSWWESCLSFSLLHSGDGMDVDPPLECTHMYKKGKQTCESADFQT